LQIHVQLRLKDADRDGAGADSARRFDKKSLVLRVKTGPLRSDEAAVRNAGQGGLTGFVLLVRPLRLRPSGR
jgi:hypothetical protein